MLFWILVIFLIVGIILFIIHDTCWNDILADISLIISIPLLALGIIGLIISTPSFVSYIGLDGQIESMNQERETIIYQLENNIYNNDNDLGLKETINEAVEWNEDIAYKKANQNDFWIGIYIPDIYEDFELIDIENIMNKGK